MAKAKKKSPAKLKAKVKSNPKSKPKAVAKVKSKVAKKKTVAKKPMASKAAAKKVAGKKSAAPNQKTAKKASPPAVKAAPVAKNQSKKLDWGNFLTPLDDRLIVQIDSSETMTAGGLYIPATVTDVSGNSKGQVVIAGRGHRDDKGRVRPMDVKTGDTVLFAQFSGAKMDIQGQDVLILRESEVLGIVEKNRKG